MIKGSISGRERCLSKCVNRVENFSLLNWEIRILGGNDHEENTNIVAMSFTYCLNHGL